MNNYFAFIVLITFISCKKSEINYDEIVYTDGNGEIISVGNNTDWQITNSDNTINFTQIDNGLSSFLNNVYGYNFEFNQNCSSDSVFESIIFYPNPVTKSETPRIRISSNKPMLIFQNNSLNYTDSTFQISSIQFSQSFVVNNKHHSTTKHKSR